MPGIIDSLCELVVIGLEIKTCFIPCGWGVSLMICNCLVRSGLGLRERRIGVPKAVVCAVLSVG